MLHHYLILEPGGVRRGALFTSGPATPADFRSIEARHPGRVVWL